MTDMTERVQETVARLRTKSNHPESDYAEASDLLEALAARLEQQSQAIAGWSEDLTEIEKQRREWQVRAGAAEAEVARLRTAAGAAPPLEFSEFREGGCIGRPYPFQYFITQAHDGRFLCHHDDTWHLTLDIAQRHAQASYQAEAALRALATGATK